MTEVTLVTLFLVLPQGFFFLRENPEEGHFRHYRHPAPPVDPLATFLSTLPTPGPLLLRPEQTTEPRRHALLDLSRIENRAHADRLIAEIAAHAETLPAHATDYAAGTPLVVVPGEGSAWSFQDGQAVVVVCPIDSDGDYYVRDTAGTRSYCHESRLAPAIDLTPEAVADPEPSPAPLPTLRNGDRVRILGWSLLGADHIGQEGTVTDADYGDGEILVQPDSDNPRVGRRIYRPTDVELIPAAEEPPAPTFEVGQVVRLLPSALDRDGAFWGVDPYPTLVRITNADDLQGAALDGKRPSYSQYLSAESVEPLPSGEPAVGDRVFITYDGPDSPWYGYGTVAASRGAYGWVSVRREDGPTTVPGAFEIGEVVLVSRASE
jgi:hypothetical protein